jgi:LuxR family transcriptional regulator, maltose regulon positive regulatory protein
MPRRENRATPKIVSGILYTDDAFTGTTVGSPAWFTWLASAATFYFESPRGTFTAHLEKRQRGGLYWIAYRRIAGRLRRSHLGKPAQLTLEHLEAIALGLSPSTLARY